MMGTWDGCGSPLLHRQEEPLGSPLASWVRAWLWAGWGCGRWKSSSSCSLIENTTMKLLEIPFRINTNPPAAASRIIES